MISDLYVDSLLEPSRTNKDGIHVIKLYTTYILILNNFLYLNCNFSCVGKMTVFWLRYLYLYRKISKLYEYLTK